MKSFRQILKWMLWLVLIALVSGGSYAYHVWQHADELLHRAVKEKLAEMAPGLNIEVGKARFDFQGRVRLFDVRILTDVNQPALVTVPEIVCQIDRAQLSSGHPAIQQIRVLKPVVWLSRDVAGVWNWQNLKVSRPNASALLPEWQIEEGEIQFEIASAEQAASAKFTKLSARLIPAGRRRLAIQVETEFEYADKFQADGHWNLEENTGDVAGTLTRLQCGAALVSLLNCVSPDFQAASQKLGLLTTHGPDVVLDTKAPVAGWTPVTETRTIASPTRPGDRLPGQTASREEVRTGSEAATPVLINALADLSFRLVQKQAGERPEVDLQARLLRGELNHPLLPFPLYDLRGTIDADMQGFSVQELTVQHGNAVGVLNGWAKFTGSDRSGEFDLQVKDLTLDERIRRRLPQQLQDIYDDLQPAGRVDVTANLKAKQNGVWTGSGLLKAKNCTAMHVRFPYRVDQVTGTVKFSPERVDIDMRGMAGQKPVTVTGRVLNPGPAGDSRIEVNVPSALFDERILAACPARLQSVLEMLRLRGTGKCMLTIIRPAGLDQGYQNLVQVQIQDGSINPRVFPYPVTNVSGTVQGDGNRWELIDLRGQHDSTPVEAHGTVTIHPGGPADIDITVTATDASFDAGLQSALPARWQSIWQEFSPRGRVSSTVQITGRPGEPIDIEIDAKISDGSIELKSFPYPLDDVQTSVIVRKQTVTVKDLSARHDEMQLRTQGVGQFETDGEWRIRLENLHVEDLVPDRRFRKALPARLREIIDTLDPRKGKMTVSGMLEFRGTGIPTDPVTAAWDLSTLYSGMSLSAGVDFDNIFGLIRLRGTWDGEKVDAGGKIDLDSLTYRGHQLATIQGPLSVKGTQLVVGSKEAVNGVATADGNGPTDKSRRLTARFIDGLLSLDGIAVLENQTSYHVRMSLQDGKLERYAQLYLPGRNKLMGLMNGWIDLYGRGTSSQRLQGRGKLLISPAALYELPVIVAVLKILSFNSPDTTAFRNALIDFDVGGGQFLFRRIDLVGDTLSLRGRGYVRFEGPLALDFYSMVGRNQLPIPIIKDLIREGTKGWVGVKVRGTMSNPQAEIEAAPQMNETLRRFLGMVDGRDQQPNEPIDRMRPARSNIATRPQAQTP